MASWKLCSSLILLCCLALSTKAQLNYKVCASAEKVNDCLALERGASRVTCVPVTDTVDCLLKMATDNADFVILTAEETLLASLAQSERYSVLASVRHMDYRFQKSAFSAVAVVRADHKGGLQSLEGGGFCHPGYGKSKEQLWSDRVLKHFERKVTIGKQECLSESKSSANDEAHNLNKFFSAACRPGSWLVDPVEDSTLKKKFPNLCSLCTADGSPDCNGYRYFEPRASSDISNSHLSAMECLTSKRGSVAYIAYNHVVDYFKSNMSRASDYALLCENGTTVALNELMTAEPACAWIRQPWSALISRKTVAEALQQDFKVWMPSGRSSGAQTWIDSLDSVIFRGKADVLEYVPNVAVSPRDYIQEGRELPTPETTSCQKALRWCTVNQTEFEKCTWVQKAALVAGIRPDLDCVKGTSNIDCLKQIKDNRADFQNIDSNFGYLARKFYNQTAVMYEETTNSGRSRVIALVKNSSDISRFENLRGKVACFPEYGGIAWTAFIRAAHEHKVISRKECDYANEVSNFFNSACAPGAKDPAHFPSKVADSDKLCSACRGFAYGVNGLNEQGIVTLPIPVPVDEECPADNTNRFYGTIGALRCLKETNADVVFIEAQYLSEKFSELSMNPEDYRVLCRNGSIASYRGFNVDDKCALSVTIDGEIVARRDDENTLSLQYFLQELDVWFGYITNTVSLIDMKVFSAFNGTKDLLFKDSTNGLATKSSENENVMNYVKLFEHIDDCSAAYTTPSSILTTTGSPDGGSSVILYIPTLFLSYAIILYNYMFI